MISVLISTKDRPRKLKKCLQSLLNSTHSAYEVIVADQSNDDNSKCVIEKLKCKKIQRISSSGGKSRGLNQCLRLSRGSVLAFTDDDCLVDRNWLERIDYYINDLNYRGIVGRVKPYQKFRHKKEKCLSITRKSLNRNMICKDPLYINFDEIGQGNNMAFKKTCLNAIGGFREWLGPGTQSGPSEDIDIFYRFYRRKYQVHYVHDALVFHDKWLNVEEENILRASYFKGMFSFMSYSLLTYLDIQVFRLFIVKLKEVYRFSKIYLQQKSKITATIQIVRMYSAVLEGTTLGLYFRTRYFMQFFLMKLQAKQKTYLISQDD